MTSVGVAMRPIAEVKSMSRMAAQQPAQPAGLVESSVRRAEPTVGALEQLLGVRPDRFERRPEIVGIGSAGPYWSRDSFVSAKMVVQGPALAKTYLNSLHGPRKAFATIDEAGHFAVFTEQDVFLKELRRECSR